MMVLALLITLLPLKLIAAPLPEFDATFEVHAFDIMFGTSKQSFRCQKQDCTLKATASPSGLASFFVSESTYEEIAFKQTADSLQWLSYSKKSGDDLTDLENVKTITLKRSANGTEVIYPEKEKRWDNQTNLYDVASIAYAIQYYKLNSLPIKGFYLQDTHGQDAITITQTNTSQELELADLETTLKAEQYQFKTRKAEVKIWLLPEYQYFPGRVDVYNIEKDRTITLLLEQPPKIL
ncbi:MAG TPA: DUF3108 domain-containing protein [Thiomicrospira sp.]|nr:DUF3108 domain-containing protein [Thiomicrospira sp.]